ncbi:hypothetical protein CBR_g10993 [Chara braunii]|uniref:Copper transport protein n=1 Tax=Chara braunii TaxID=69332 RepID=A0A388KPX7_CHABU|nr:hypothetical protein CBR_g10993 [Chara braunii]|eukprot:GBG72058.1 hypothetical protein CBR_g10993 [Chara braunii]
MLTVYGVFPSCLSPSSSVSVICRPSRSNTSKAHLLSSFLYLVNVTSSYLLMLIVMTYNAGLFVAVVLGLSCGYLIFRRPAVRANDAYSAETCCP